MKCSMLRVLIMASLNYGGIFLPRDSWIDDRDYFQKLS